MSEPLLVRPGLELPAASLSWTAVRASGPGGQNVNKVASKVELRFDPRAAPSLDLRTRERLVRFAGTRIDAEGRVVFVSQATRDQRQNLEDARSKLVELVLRALERDKPRRPTKPSRGAKERRLGEKKKHGEKKRARSGCYD